jgi:hypothetical protein
MSPRTAFFDRRGRLSFAAQALCFALLALGLSAAWLGLPGTEDVPVFIRWANVLRQYGPFAGYAHIADYPPLAPFLLWLAVGAGRAVAMPDLLAVKLTIALFQLAACLIVARRYGAWAPACLLWLLMSPLGLINGYLDPLFLPFVLLGLFALERDDLAWGAVWFTIAALIKWQPAVMGPVVLVYAVSRMRGIGQIAWAMPAALCALAVLLAFGPAAMLTAFLGATGDPFFSGQAFNLDWIITVALAFHQGAGPHVLTGGLLAFPPHIPAVWWVLSRALYWSLYLALLGVFAMRRRSWTTLVLTLTTAEAIQFTFNTGVHENHSFLVMALAFVAFQEGVLGSVMFTIVATLTLSNVLLFYGVGMGAGVPALIGTLSLSLLDIVVCLALLRLTMAALINPRPAPAAVIAPA